MGEQTLPADVGLPEAIETPFTEDDFPIYLKVEYNSESQIFEVAEAKEYHQPDHPSREAFTIEGIPAKMLNEDVVLSIKKVLTKNVDFIVTIV